MSVLPLKLGVLDERLSTIWYDCHVNKLLVSLSDTVMPKATTKDHILRITRSSVLKSHMYNNA